MSLKKSGHPCLYLLKVMVVQFSYLTSYSKHKVVLNYFVAPSAAAVSSGSPRDSKDLPRAYPT